MVIKMFILKFLNSLDNHLETIHGQHTWQTKILKHNFIGSVTIYSNLWKKNKRINLTTKMTKERFWHRRDAWLWIICICLQLKDGSIDANKQCSQ
jgi:hypothetical protein